MPQTFTSLSDTKDALAGLHLQETMVPSRSVSLAVDGDHFALRLPNSRQFRIDLKHVKTNLNELTGLSTQQLWVYHDDPELLARCVTHNLSKKAEKNLRVITTGDGKLIELFSESYPWINPQEALSICGDVIGERLLGVESSQFDHKSGLDIRFLTHRAAEPPKRKGDISHSGVYFHANGEFETSAFVYRMVCSNGMIAPQYVAKRSSRDVMQQSFRDNIHAALTQADSLLDEFIESDNHRAQNPRAFITQMVGRHQHSDRLHTLLQESAATLPDDATRYDVINMVTARRHSTNNPAYERVGFDALQDFRHELCTHCGHTV